MMFDFSALCDSAIRLCPGADRVAHCEKKEDRCNRVFILTMNRGSCVVARLPTGIAGPPRLTTNSEVATMTYCAPDSHSRFVENAVSMLIIDVGVVRGKISLPIPKILDWSDDPSNPIGAEYIIQEHAVGVSLRDIWPRMNVLQHMQCTQALSIGITKISILQLPGLWESVFCRWAPGAAPEDSIRAGILHWSTL